MLHLKDAGVWRNRTDVKQGPKGRVGPNSGSCELRNASARWEEKEPDKRIPAKTPTGRTEFTGGGRKGVSGKEANSQQGQSEGGPQILDGGEQESPRVIREDSRQGSLARKSLSYKGPYGSPREKMGSEAIRYLPSWVWGGAKNLTPTEGKSFVSSIGGRLKPVPSLHLHGVRW